MDAKKLRAELNEKIRQLAAKYKQFPVRIVGIMSNVDQTNLKAASERGDLDWTVLPQPLNGPLQLDWGIEGYPSVYVVDAKGILHPQLHMPYWGAGGHDSREIDEKLEALLRRDRLAKSEQNANESVASNQLTTVAAVEAHIEMLKDESTRMSKAKLESASLSLPTQQDDADPVDGDGADPFGGAS